MDRSDTVASAADLVAAASAGMLDLIFAERQDGTRSESEPQESCADLAPEV